MVFINDLYDISTITKGGDNIMKEIRSSVLA